MSTQFLIDFFFNDYLQCAYREPCARCVLSHFSHVQLFVTPWTLVHQAPLSMRFFRQEYWSGVPLPSPLTNLDSILKSRDITLSTKIRLVKAVVFPVVMYGCES